MQHLYHATVVHTLVCVAVHMIVVPKAWSIVCFLNETFLMRFVNLALISHPIMHKKPYEVFGVKIHVLFVGNQKLHLFTSLYKTEPCTNTNWLT